MHAAEHWSVTCQENNLSARSLLARIVL